MLLTWIMNQLTSDAVAQTVEAGTQAVPPAGMSFAGILPVLGMFGVLYILLIRPQQKKLNEHKRMISELRRGDKVVTSGGIIGTIQKLEGDDIVLVEIAPEVRVRIAKLTISSVMTRTEPAGKDDKVANEN